MSKASFDKIATGLREAIDWAEERRKQEEAQKAFEAGKAKYDSGNFTPAPNLDQKSIN